MPAPATLSSQLELLISERIAGDVRVDEMTLGLYSTDASIYQMKPAGVVFPRSTADVREVVQIARRHGVPILARGAGTSLSGQTITPGLVLDFTRYMNRILEVDADRGLVRVEAGVVLDQLNAELQSRGLLFGPDVATSNRASLGG